MAGLASLIDLLFTLYTFLIIGRVLLVMANVNPYHPVMQWIIRLTEPVLSPIRNMMPRTGMVDWSPMVAVVGLFILQQIVRAILLGF
jgi:YggT family protein